VPVGNADALICDTGALIDYLVESAPDHKRFRDAIDQARTRYVLGWCPFTSTRRPTTDHVTLHYRARNPCVVPPTTNVPTMSP